MSKLSNKIPQRSNFDSLLTGSISAASIVIVSTADTSAFDAESGIKVRNATSNTKSKVKAIQESSSTTTTSTSTVSSNAK